MEANDPDGPDELRIGPIVVPIIEDDDPRYTEDRAAWSSARAIAQSLHSWDELSSGLKHREWRVRHESIPRISARWREDPRTLAALLGLATEDPSPAVREAAVMSLLDFPGEAVGDTLQVAAQDADSDVRWSANFALAQHGFDHEPFWDEG